MKGQEHIAEIEWLHAEGLSDREIGEQVGVSASTVWKLRHPERTREMIRRDNARRAETKRAWAKDPANRVVCSVCGGLTGSTSGQHRDRRRPDGDRRCRACYLAEERKRIAERGHQIERWWAEGLTIRQIGDRLGGWSKARATVEVVRFRAKGFYLPYRRTPEQVARIKAGSERDRKARAA